MDASEGSDEEEIQLDKLIHFIISDSFKSMRIFSDDIFKSRCTTCVPNRPTNERIALKLQAFKQEEWFSNEIASAIRLKHENIIRVYGRTHMGVIIERIERKSLKEVINDESISCSLGEILLWGTHFFRASEYVIQTFPGELNEHFRLYFHRIVCPENMILNPTRDVLKICSLGLFQDIPDPNYWAPEVRNREYKYEESDVYPFGVVLKECLTREEPQIYPELDKIFPKSIKNIEHPVNMSSMFQQFIDRCTIDKPSKNRLPVSVIRTILENMVLSEKGKNWDIHKSNTISLWNDNQLYYWKESIFFSEEEASTTEVGKNEDQKSQLDENFLPYRLLEVTTKISEGVFGSAYECIFKPTNERRTLKLLPLNQEICFKPELASALRLKHENIIRVYGQTCVGEINSILTEWIAGTSLKQVIHDKSITYSPTDILLWNTQFFKALEYIIESFSGKENEHFRRYFNQIVCPQNMILNPTRDVLKICALGLFKDIPDPKYSDETNYSYYWAPEVRNGEYKNEKSDVYPFGVVLWECITRKKPIFDEEKYAFKTTMKTASLKFYRFLERCAFLKPQDRFPLSVIKTILENMVLAEKEQNLHFYKGNCICFWNKEELYYCKKLISVTFSPIEIEKELFNDTIFDYKLLKNMKVLGSGSYGKVCSADYEDKKVAVKFLVAMKIEPFLIEFETLFCMKHENIAKVIGQTEEVGVYGIVMELVDGTSLDKIIHETSEKYSLGDVLKWNYQAASALNYMHSRQCLHRDIKPQNMMIESSEKRTLKLIDFSGAKWILSSISFNRIGTDLYMAPEMENKASYNEQCDVYSWAITFWECLTAQKPQRPPDYRSKINQICSMKFIKVLEKCSSSTPSHRKPMIIIKNWLGEMLKHRKTFTETDSIFRENHVCVWNEPTDELYYFPKTESEKRFQFELTEAKTSFTNVPMDSLKILYDLGDLTTKSGNYKIIEIDGQKQILKFSKDGDEKYLENEFLALSKLKHENIIKLLGYTHDNELGFFGIITEFFSDMTLEQVFLRNLHFLTKDIIEWGLQTARALEHMHSQNILHCDFKPANIILYISGGKICNFKLSRDLQYEHPKEAVGTGIYMAPEVKRDGLLTTKSDVYSWTVTFWQLCKMQNNKMKNLVEKEENEIMQYIEHMESIDLWEERERSVIVNGSNKFNDFIYTCSNEDSDIRWTMADIATLLENMLDSNSNASKVFVPNWENVYTDKHLHRMAEDNICFWSNAYQQHDGENLFFYASDDIPLIPRTLAFLETRMSRHVSTVK